MAVQAQGEASACEYALAHGALRGGGFQGAEFAVRATAQRNGNSDIHLGHSSSRQKWLPISEIRDITGTSNCVSGPCEPVSGIRRTLGQVVADQPQATCVRLATRVGSAPAKYPVIQTLGHKSLSVACEPTLWPSLPTFRGNGFSPPETEGPKLRLKRSFFPAETGSRPAPLQNRGYSSNHGKSRLAGREDSNLEPFGSVELSGCPLTNGR
jgi:hypothetical protein